MAKVYIGSPKYIIKGEFEVDCVVEKPDVIGAVFGQSEGLLGEDMDFKELQQSGKIGRIEVEIEVKMGKTIGTLMLPSSLDKVQTSLIAATIESVDKIGPGKAYFKISGIVDNRKDKRQAIEERAKQLLERLSKDSVDQSELENKIRKEVRTKNLVKINGLEAGPDVEKSKEIIIVEGRADVMNLLKYGINNAIALNGSNVPYGMKDFVKGKILTLLVDGDRGGQLIAKKVYSMLGVDYIAVAPEGTEVEELPGKTLIGILKKKIPSSEFFKDKRERSSIRREPNGRNYNEGLAPRTYTPRRYEEKPTRRYEERTPVSDNPLLRELKKIEGSFKAIFLDSSGNKIEETALRDAVKKMSEIKAETLLMDGIITSRIVEEAEKSGIKTIVGLKSTAKETKGIKIISAGYQRT